MVTVFCHFKIVNLYLNFDINDGNLMGVFCEGAKASVKTSTLCKVDGSEAK